MASETSMNLSEKALKAEPQRWLTRRKLLIFGGVAIAIIIALAVGLGVGLSLHSGNDDGNDNDQSGTPLPTSSNVPTNGTWQPAVGTSWQLELKYPLNDTSTSGIGVWDIDLFDNNATIIDGLRSNGAKVICYFSAGSYEDWRLDADKFKSSDLGKNLDGWPGEKWLNVSSQNVRSIMLSRLDLAVEKECDGVDPDNVDGYDNDNGLGLTQGDAVDYVKFLANAAHARNISVGLKNAGDIIDDVLPYMQWSVNEQCVAYNECDTYAPFIRQGKPVFHVEYPKGADTNNNDEVSTTIKDNICDNSTAQGFSSIIKNMDLDLWIESC